MTTWRKEAIQQNIDFVVILYGKAEGFVFCPKNKKRPFRVGGDYDGSVTATAKGALDYYELHFNRHFEKDVAWFIPFVKKVKSNQDFSLADLNIKGRKLSVISGDWPW